MLKAARVRVAEIRALIRAEQYDDAIDALNGLEEHLRGGDAEELMDLLEEEWARHKAVSVRRLPRTPSRVSTSHQILKRFVERKREEGETVILYRNYKPPSREPAYPTMTPNIYAADLRACKEEHDRLLDGVVSKTAKQKSKRRSNFMAMLDEMYRANGAITLRSWHKHPESGPTAMYGTLWKQWRKEKENDPHEPFFCFSFPNMRRGGAPAPGRGIKIYAASREAAAELHRRIVEEAA